MSVATYAREGYVGMLDALVEDLVLSVRLYVNDPVISADSVRADFVEASYDGYIPYRIPKWTPSALRGGVAISVPDIPHFVAAGPPWPTGIRGYYVTHGDLGPLAFAWRRPAEAFSFAADRTVLTVYIRLQFPF